MVNEIVKNHTMSQDMKTMLSDKRVKFSYFDVFETDYGVIQNVMGTANENSPSNSCALVSKLNSSES